MSGDSEFDPALPTHVAIFRSWKSIKTSVMIWLWFLNAIYLCAFLWLDQVEARYALLAYIAILPCAMAIAIPQRGLTRLSGLMHVPFLVFAIWVAPSVLSFKHGGIYGAWLQLVFWTTVVCIVFDILDALRWIKGERYRLGSPQAVQAQASKAAKLD